MDYLAAAAHTVEELDDPTADAVSEQAAIELVVHAWPHLAPADPAWDWIAIDLLSIRDTLYPERAPIVVLVDPPEQDDPPLRAAIRQLFHALATRYDHVTHADTAPLTRRLQHAAAAIQLRELARRLP